MRTPALLRADARAGTHARMRANSRARGKLALVGPLALLAAATMLAGPMLVAAQTAEDPSNVVLVFDVSTSILLSEEGLNDEFADALEGTSFGAERAKEGGDLRVKSAEKLRDAVVAALGKIHALLDAKQRAELAYLIRTGTLSI